MPKIEPAPADSLSIVPEDSPVSSFTGYSPRTKTYNIKGQNKTNTSISEQYLKKIKGDNFDLFNIRHSILTQDSIFDFITGIIPGIIFIISIFFLFSEQSEVLPLTTQQKQEQLLQKFIISFTPYIFLVFYNAYKIFVLKRHHSIASLRAMFLGFIVSTLLIFTTFIITYFSY